MTAAQSLRRPLLNPRSSLTGLVSAWLAQDSRCSPCRAAHARKLLPPVRSSLASLVQVAQSPTKLALLFGGSALVTLAYIGGLVASVEAFGGGPGIAEVGAVYLVVSVIAAASPTSGGLGAFETAAIAGLGGIGLSSGAAVSAVLTFRLAT